MRRISGIPPRSEGEGMQRLKIAAIVAGAATLAVAAAVVRGPLPGSATASSHREAPLISQDPSADNTDLYAFRSIDRPDALTVVSNWIPAEDPAAGPMYYEFSPTARYNIHLDRNGDGKPDVTYRFEFEQSAPVAFLRSTTQAYTVTRVVGGKAKVIGAGMTPPDNVGPRTTPDYHALATGAVKTLDGVTVFAGQREDAFFGDIGQIFDSLGFRKGTGSTGGGKDFFAGYGVHAIALQIPIADIDTSSHVVGVWATTERPKITVSPQPQQLKLRVKGKTIHRKVLAARASHAWVQVSRLGNPLFNELIVPTELKD